MRHPLLALILLLTALPATAGEVVAVGYRVEIPDDWEQQRDRMGVSLLARPARASDPVGWGSELLTVTVEAADLRRSCLEGYSLRKLQQLAYHAEGFERLDEEPLELGGAVASRYSLRYREGPRELMAYVLVMQSGARFVTATLTAPPARFEFQRARYRQLLDSLRPAP